MELPTLILVTVTIALALAIAFWAATVASQYTGLELLEVKCTAEGRGEAVAVTVTIANKGTKAATVLGVEVNGELKEVLLTVKPGETRTFEVEAPKARAVQVNVRTRAGEYLCATSVKG